MGSKSRSAIEDSEEKMARSPKKGKKSAPAATGSGDRRNGKRWGRVKPQRRHGGAGGYTYERVHDMALARGITDEAMRQEIRDRRNGRPHRSRTDYGNESVKALTGPKGYLYGPASLYHRGVA